MRKLLLLALTLAVSITVAGAYGGPPTGQCEVKGRGALSYDSLQAAVNAANPGDTVRVRGTCVGTTVVDRNLAITGQQQDATLDGGNAGTVVTVNSGMTVEINRLTITNNGGCCGSDRGIMNFGTLTISGSAVVANRRGGGIENHGALTVSGSSIDGNSTTVFGGGVLNDTGATATIQRTSIDGNHANIGGGIVNRGTMTLVDCTVDDNITGEGHGGILNTGMLNATRCSISRNGGSSFDGGGIKLEGGSATLNRCSVIGNRAGSSGGIGVGFGTTLILNDSTVADNFGTFGGGGIGNGGTVILAGTTRITGNAIALDTINGHGGGIYNGGTLQGAVPGVGGNVYNNIPDDIYPYP
jgi:hypothetical protein